MWTERSTSRHGEHIYNKMSRPRLYSDEERKQRKKTSVAKYYQSNKEDIKVKQREYVISNPDIGKQYYVDNKETIVKRISHYNKQRRHSDHINKLQHNIRMSINAAFKRKTFSKQSKTTDILGCTINEFRQHIESQFESWMTWDNYGCKVPLGPDITWDLDHIIPISSAVTEDDVKRLNHYTNFQPLCSYQNRFVKRDKI